MVWSPAPLVYASKFPAMIICEWLCLYIHTYHFSNIFVWVGECDNVGEKICQLEDCSSRSDGQCVGLFVFFPLKFLILNTFIKMAQDKNGECFLVIKVFSDDRWLTLTIFTASFHNFYRHGNNREAHPKILMDQVSIAQPRWIKRMPILSYQIRLVVKIIIINNVSVFT